MPKCTAIVAEDDQDCRELLRILLEREGITVITVSDGAEALRLARQVKVDVVLADIYMTKVSGIELIQRLRANQSDIPVVIFSGDGDGLRQEAKAAGAFKVLVKPMDIDQIVLSINEALLSTRETA